MKNGKMWSNLSALLGGLGFLLAIATPFIESKAAPYEEEESYKRLEERYGLKPIEKEED